MLTRLSKTIGLSCIAVAFILVSCSNINRVAQIKSSTSFDAAPTISNVEDNSGLLQSNADIYFCDYGFDDKAFCRAVQYNPIDCSFDTSTIGNHIEFVGYINKYIDIWKSELNYSLDNLKSLLDDNQKILLDSSQKLWEESRTASSNLECSIVYTINNSEMERERCLYETLKRYRERTIRIKYMTYILEAPKDELQTPTPTDERLSVKFIFSL